MVEFDRPPPPPQVRTATTVQPRGRRPGRPFDSVVLPDNGHLGYRAVADHGIDERNRGWRFGRSEVPGPAGAPARSAHSTGSESDELGGGLAEQVSQTGSLTR